ncbi:MAG: xanthine dehydrogenase family protein molybdopterin-binding subunit [Gammaproteobacteria bacterium]|nr:xanthine dehydrogenase family protein molybdopterin-binding subunit [Gammaproteobacteria bacterium]
MTSGSIDLEPGFGRRVKLRATGQPLRRNEDERLLRGLGRFTDDQALPGQAHAVVVRADHAHARIRGLDVARARAAAGVLDVITGADCATAGLGAIDHSPLPSTRDDLKLTAADGGDVFVGPHLLLPTDKVRHVGEALALVVADTREQALDAAELVELDLEPIEAVTDSAAAARADAVPVWAELEGNVCVDTWFGDREAVREAFARAAHVVELSAHVDRVTGVPLEPRSALAHFDPVQARYTLYAGSGGAVRQKREIAQVLGIEPERLRILCHDVGGNFGTRNRVYVEFALVLLAAARIGRPVKYTATRRESFLSDYQGRDLRTRTRIALDRDGRILALEADNLSNVGARVVSLSPLGKGSALVTGSYHVPHACVRARAVLSNTVPTQAYRSSGRPEVNYAIERLIDKAAGQLGLDPLALRRLNLVDSVQMPYTNALGAVYDSGDYAANMDKVMALADWSGYPARAARARCSGRLPGRGLANYVESSIGSPRERAEIELGRDGHFEVVIGTQPSGQGHHTSFAQVSADLLGVDFESVRIITGDTDVVQVGGGSHSGRSMRHAGTVIAMASARLIDQARERLANIVQRPVTSIQFEDGVFLTQESNRSLSWAELADMLEQRGLTPLRVVCDNEMHTPVYPNGAAVAEVEVDPETGSVHLTRYAAVDDVGRAINPLILHGQTHGCIAQGVGQALGELCIYDTPGGQALSGSLLDYALPRADDLPDFDTELVEVLSPTNPLGIKSGGEGATTPSLAVMVIATLDALRELGVQDLQMPLTPARVWQAIREAKERSTS